MVGGVGRHTADTQRAIRPASLRSPRTRKTKTLGGWSSIVADARDVVAVAAAIREMDWSGDAPTPEAIAEVALNTIAEQPRRAKEIRGNRNG